MNQENDSEMGGAEQHAAGAVRIHIERLVLEGFDGTRPQLQRFAAEFTSELERQLTGAEFAPGSARTSAGRRIPHVTLHGSDLNHHAARGIAGAVVSGLPVSVRDTTRPAETRGLR